MKILLRAPFDRLSGYGNDAVDIARWLDKLDVDVSILPTSMMNPLPKDFVHLLTKPLQKTGFDVGLQFLPPFYISVRRRMSDMRSNHGMPKRAAELHVGWSMWEKDRLTAEDMRGHGLGGYPWTMLDTMYVTCPMNVEAFANYDPRPEYRVLPCGIDGDLFPVSRRSTDGTLKFCMIGQLHTRKDPWVAIDAYRELKQEHGDRFDAELYLKTNTVGLHPGIMDLVPGVHVYQEMWPYEQLIDWMHEMHVYLGPSRGEGNLKPPMEFMATGGTAIVTNWSGPQNWMDESCSYPLDYVLRGVNPADPESPKEARADKEHLKRLMWHAHENRQEVSDFGMLASKHIREVADWRNVIARLIGELEADLG